MMFASNSSLTKTNSIPDHGQLRFFHPGEPCAEFRRVFDHRAGMGMRGCPAAGVLADGLMMAFNQPKSSSPKA